MLFLKTFFGKGFNHCKGHHNCGEFKSRSLRLIKIGRYFLLILTCIALISPAQLNWQKVYEQMRTRFGESGVHRLADWQKMLEQNKSKTTLEKIQQVNDFFNRSLLFEEDIVIWKKTDYWATPLESMGMGAGDCEDFSIAKYISLLELGVPNQQLHLIYVKAQLPNGNQAYQAHMVLGYYSEPNAVPLILDNLIPEIKSAELRKDLLPIFSFNSDGLWIGNQVRQDPTTRLSRWRDLLDRAKQEGFDIH